MRSPPSLPATVVRALAAVRRRRRTFALLEAAAWSAVGIAAVVLLLPAVGAPEEGPGSWVRILARIWLIGWAVGSVIRFVIPPWRRTADPLNLARAVDDRVSETRDSLHAAVDLAGALDDGRWDDPVTRHLARDHLAAASDRVSVVDPRALLPWSSLGRGVLLGPGLLFVAGLVLLAAPEPSQRGWDRLFGPLPAGDFAAEDAESAEDAEPVTLVLRNLVLTLTPPAYSLRETLTLDGTTGDFQALPGTAVALAADVPSGGEDVAVVWYAPEGDPVRFEAIGSRSASSPPDRATTGSSWAEDASARPSAPAGSASKRCRTIPLIWRSPGWKARSRSNPTTCSPWRCSPATTSP